MKSIRHLARNLERAIESAGRTRARRALLARSDRVLADAGFSRELLLSGNDAWPWRLENEAPAVTPVRTVTPVSRIVPGAPVPIPVEQRKEAA